MAPEVVRGGNLGHDIVSFETQHCIQFAREKYDMKGTMLIGFSNFRLLIGGVSEF